MSEREQIARIICYWDETGTCHDNYCVGRCVAVKPDNWFFQAADHILQYQARRAVNIHESEKS